MLKSLSVASAFILFFYASVGIFAQTAPKRLGVIDIEADALKPGEKENLLLLLKQKLNGQRVLTVVHDDEIETNLVQKNKLRAEVERVRLEHQNKRAEIERQLEEGQRYYLASQFEEAITVLQNTFLSLRDAGLALKPSIVQELLKVLAACYFFMGNEDQAKAYLSTLLDIDESAFLSAQRFPPPLIQLFNSLKLQPRFVWKSVSFATNVRGIKATFLGVSVDVQEGESLELKLPVDHPVLGNEAVIVEKEGFAPILFLLTAPPSEFRFVSIRDKKISTKGLFGPIGSSTPPTELKNVAALLNLSVVLLASASHDENGRLAMRGQWLEAETQRTSPVVVVSERSAEHAVNELVLELMQYLSSDGFVLNEKMMPTPSASPEVFEEEVGSTPFYKTWWFWTAVGVGVVGAGIGSYYLFKTPDQLKLAVEPKN